MLSKVEIIKNKLITDIKRGVFRVGEKSHPATNCAGNIIFHEPLLTVQSES